MNISVQYIIILFTVAGYYSILPENQAIVAGNRFTLKCTFSNVGYPTTIQWEEKVTVASTWTVLATGGAVVTGHPWASHVVDSVDDLTITSATIEFAGRYRCSIIEKYPKSEPMVADVYIVGEDCYSLVKPFVLNLAYIFNKPQLLLL